MNARKSNIIETTTDTYAYILILLSINHLFSSEQTTTDDNPLDHTTNIFVTQTDSTIQNESQSDSRSNASTSGIPKLPQISSPTMT